MQVLGSAQCTASDQDPPAEGGTTGHASRYGVFFSSSTTLEYMALYFSVICRLAKNGGMDGWLAGWLAKGVLSTFTTNTIDMQVNASNRGYHATTSSSVFSLHIFTQSSHEPEGPKLSHCFQSLVASRHVCSSNVPSHSCLKR